jgi:hypothetical protein
MGFCTHRVFAFRYNLQCSYCLFEILAALVLLQCFFWVRRNVIRSRRFFIPDLKGFPKNDANYILYFEVVLMTLFLLMNASDLHLQNVPGGLHFIKGFFSYKSSLLSLFLMECQMN